MAIGTPVFLVLHIQNHKHLEDTRLTKVMALLFSYLFSLQISQAQEIRKAPDKIGNVNKSIPPVIKKAQGNNGIVFNVR